jgi:hemolysin activation/secretion protein
LLGLLLGQSQVHASSIIDMPDTTEVPEFERSSMLLDMDIPSVRERDPDPMAGPRLNVKEFRVQGLVEYPEMGISREEIIKRVEEIRFDLMEEGKLLESGYTVRELSELSDMLAEIEDETTIEHVGPIEVQRLVFLIREQRRERGVTLGMIEMVADTITRYYRERGFVLAKAFIPKQHVRDGVVTLTLLLGELGEVEVHNNKHYSEKRIASIFNGAMGKPITAQNIEEHLYFVNDMPRLSAQGFFEAGSQVGDSKLNINVLSERWYNANLRLDNHGTSSSGEYRLYADFLWHNPLGIGDQLQLGILNSFKPDNSLYGSIRYNTQVLSPRVRLSAGFSNNDFAVASNMSDSLSDLGIEGRSRVADAAVKYILKRSRVKNYSFGVRLAQIESQIRFAEIAGGEDIGLDDEIRNVELFFDFDTLNEANRRLHQGRVSITSSDFILGVEENQEEKPWLFNADYTMLTFVDLPLIKDDTRLVLRSSIQYAATSLSTINQFSLAGPTRARGYVLNEFFADDGVHVGADWVFKGPSFGGVKLGGQPLSDAMQPFVFADASYGIAHRTWEGAEDAVAQLGNIGAGLKFNFGTNARGNLLAALPVAGKKKNESGTFDLDDGVKVYFDFQYSF